MPKGESGDWDPKPSERRYYRNARTGDLGYLVERDGKDVIRYDRPNEEILRPYRQDEWIVEREHRKLTAAQIAHVAFEADKKLCLFIGLPNQANREWLSMKDEERIRWIKDGPSSGLARMHLFGAIKFALEAMNEQED